MYKVKNRRVLKKIADKTMKAGRGRNIIVMIATALTSVLFTSVFTIGGSIIQKQQEATMRQVGGSSHAGYKYLTQAEYDIVKNDKKLKEVSYRIVVGDAVNKELNKLHTEVSYYEDLDAQMCFCYPKTGHMPQAKDEIVTSDLVLKALGIPCELGAKVALTINTGKIMDKKVFTLSGYFAGDSIAQAQVVAVSKAYAQKIAPTPTESAMEQGVDASDYAGRIMADFNFSNSFRIPEQVAELTARCGFPEDVDLGVNWAYMGSLDTGSMALAGFLCLMILIAGYLIIYNIFYINVYRDIRYYGLLKTVGTTGKQLRRIVRHQAYRMALYGIPLGLAIGAAVGQLLLPVVMGQLVFSDSIDTRIELNVWAFAGAGLFSFCTVYLSCIRPCRVASKVSPIDAAKYTEGQDQAGDMSLRKKDLKKKQKKTKRVTPKAMALQNIKRNKGKILVTVASLSLSLVLLNCIYGLIRGFDMDKYVFSLTTSDFSVSDATLDNVSVDYRSIVMDGVTDTFLEALQEQPGVEEVGNIYIKESDHFFSDEEYALIEQRIYNDPKVQETLDWKTGGDEEVLSYYKDDQFMDGKVYGIGKMVMEKLEDPEGTLDWEKFSSGKYVIAARYDTMDEQGVAFFLPGEQVTIANEEGEERQYEVLAVADMPYACGLQHFGMFDCNYILPEEEYLDFMGKQSPMRTIFNVEQDYEEQMEAWIADYCEKVEPDLQYTSKASIVAEFDSYKDMYVIVGGLLALILAFIGILNFINTMSTSVLSRKQEFAMMEAVGMTGKQLRQMLCCEGGYYALLTTLCALILASIMSTTVIRSMGEEIFFYTWRFSILPIILCIPALAVVAVAVPMFCYKSMVKDSIVERMRRME